MAFLPGDAGSYGRPGAAGVPGVEGHVVDDPQAHGHECDDVDRVREADLLVVGGGGKVSFEPS
jgi:hypothetical protein